MAQATLHYVPITAIEPNPYRDLTNYPYDERKLEALMRSIDDVGLWESLIARPHGDRHQLAFGHHRWEAARRKKLKEVPLIVRDLSDEEMVGFMGRENLEDFNSDFLVQLNAWEAAIKIHGTYAKVHSVQPTTVARLLGWTIGRSDRDHEKLNVTASACHVATKLIEAGHMSRADLADMNVSVAREVVERIHSRIESLDKLGRMGKRPAAEIARDQKHVATAGRQVARDVREGTIGRSHIRQEIDYRAIKSAGAKGKVSPLFAAFAKEVADSIHKMLISDNTSVRLSEMEKALHLVSLEEDRAALRRIDFALAEHGETTARWRERLSPKGQRVVPLKLLKKEEA